MRGVYFCNVKMVARVLEFLLRMFQWIPVIFINTVIVWSYYAYVFVLCVENVPSKAEKAIYLILYHPLFLMLMISYWRTIMAEAGRIPSQFYMSRSVKEHLDNVDNPEEVLKGISRKLPLVTQTISGGVRVCEVCQVIKPDRCHHCSMCRKCILKMDHHCPWVNNCVGFTNYKFFLLFLFHAILYTAYITATETKYFIAFWNNELHGEGKLHVLFLFFVALMFSISLWALFGYHLFLTCSNRSTLESFRVPHFQHGPDKEGFSLGSAIKNATQILGENKWLWCIPVHTSVGDGIHFPVHSQPEEDNLLNERQRWSEEGDMETTEENLGLDSQRVTSDNLAASPAELTHENETAELQVVVSHPHAVRPDILTVAAGNNGDDDGGTTL